MAPRIYNLIDTEEKLKYFNHHIIELYERHVPLKKHKTRSDKKHSPVLNKATMDSPE